MLTGIDGCWRECETVVKQSSVSRCDAYYKKVKDEYQETSASMKHITCKVTNWAVTHKSDIGIVIAGVYALIFCSWRIIPESIYYGFKRYITEGKYPRQK